MKQNIITIVSICFCVVSCDYFFEDEGNGNGEISGSVDCDATDGDELAEKECEVFDLVNERRTAGANCGQYGDFEPTHALTLHPDLTEAARLHSLDMGEQNYFSHDSLNGDSYVDRIEAAGYVDWSYVGENIAAGDSTAEGVMNGWMNSDGHCANIMSPDFTQIGVGYAMVPGSSYVHYWTQDFGTPL